MKHGIFFKKTEYRFIAFAIAAVLCFMAFSPVVSSYAEETGQSETNGTVESEGQDTSVTGGDTSADAQAGTAETPVATPVPNAPTPIPETPAAVPTPVPEMPTATPVPDTPTPTPTAVPEQPKAKLSVSSLEIYEWQEEVISLLNVSESANIEWSVSEPSIVSILRMTSNRGDSVAVCGLSAGSTTVTAEYDGIRYTCKVKVLEPSVNYTYKLLNVGDKFTLKVKGAEIVSFISDNENIASVSNGGKVTAKAAGSTTILLIADNGEIFTCNVFIFDGEKADNQYLTKRTVTDDLWLTSAVKAGETTLERSTGLKLIKETKKGYKVAAGDLTFEISASLVTNVCPAVTPTPSVADTSFKVDEGILVNYTSNLMYSGTPKGLVYLKDSNMSTHISFDKGCRLQKDVIDPLREMIDDAWAAGGWWFNISASGAYRSFNLQDTYWKNRIASTPTYGDDPYNNGGTKCVPAVSSEHRTGFAIDIQSNDSAYKWLNANCYKYGFILRYTADKTKYTGVMDEYWHYTYVGKGVAYTCFNEGLCLEEYYLKYVDPAAAIPFE